MTVPFQYPAGPHVRIHGPRGYTDYESYRDWLRDEFAFRCVYCLVRETWLLGGFHIDHFVPATLTPQLSTDYANLLYSCSTCNLAKQSQSVPDPTLHLLANTVEIRADGTLQSLTQEAEKIVERLRLNRATYRNFRKLWISVVAMAKSVDPELWKQLLGYPEALPDLSVLRPPDGNTNPEGIEQSHDRRRQRGELPDTY